MIGLLGIVHNLGQTDRILGTQLPGQQDQKQDSDNSYHIPALQYTDERIDVFPNYAWAFI
ncbi:hypothetical protein GCM10007423_06380 [Dyadobacter endophyticus]|uniref:Uncharacterized protein n=1 Tax=Dyadobacter endophyticus TaxID=1749036 RepID=A0ABQ1YFB1_9BACT|nr:hypothetical protein GCM10007423_06380 [Dyadobacter endophyticus]